MCYCLLFPHNALHSLYVRYKYIHFSFVTPVTGLNRPNTGKEDDDDERYTLKC
jgi:hypothetical protein